MAPRGNRTERRGHRNKIGGPKSRGTISKTVKMPVELWKRVKRAIGRLRFSKYIREIIVRDLGR